MASTLLRANSIGRVIDGRFPLLQELGRTEWSSAYLTEIDDDRVRKAAIKLFLFQSVDSRVTITRWDVARTLSHPHLMPLYHAGRCEIDGEDVLYVVTEFAEETLSQILPERPLSPDEAREMLEPVLDGLAYLHRLGLTHGHLRPTNIMVVADRLKLSPDFGWRSRSRSVYDPPEAASGNPNAAADIWSIGILLVECFTQRPPAWDHSQSEAPNVPDTIPEPFFSIAQGCLQVDPASRPTLAAIEELLNPPSAKKPVESMPAQPVIAPAKRPEKSYKSLAFIVACLSLALVFLVAAFRFGWDMTPSPLTQTRQSEASVQAAAQPQAAAPTVSLEPVTSQPPSSEGEPAQNAAPAATLVPVAEQASQPAASVPAQPVATEAAPDPKPIVAPAQVVTTSAGNVIHGSVAHQELPDIPAKITATIQGHVKVGVRVAVDADGNVLQASIDSAGPSHYFADQSLHAAENWKFTPAQVNGHAVASTWLLQFQFGQSDISANESEETP